MTRKTALVAIVALLAVGMSAALVAGTGPVATDDAAMAQDTTAENETTTAMDETTVAETADVTIEEQTSNGSEVVVDEVVVPEGGFVVIHAAEEAEEMATETEMETEMEAETEMETDTVMETEMETEAGEETAADGEMAQQYTAGEVLGNSTYLDAGTHEDVTVELDAALDESQVVVAMPHLDTNDNQAYEFPEADDPYTDDDAAVTDWANVTVEEDAGETTVADDEETTVADDEEENGDELDAGTTTEET